MNIAELITKLQAFSPLVDVTVDGMDWDRDIEKVEWDEDSESVVIVGTSLGMELPR